MRIDLSQYTLTLADDFGDSTLDRDLWRTAYGWSGGAGRTLAGNHEAEFYCDPLVTPKINPFSIRNGSLVLLAAPSIDLTETNKLPYSSGMISTWDTWNQTYGYFEIRAKLPTGAGFWPAFWMLPADITWPPEIDVFETFGGTRQGQGSATEIYIGVEVKTGSSAAVGEGAKWVTVPADTRAGFHSYGVSWEADFITWYFDQEEIAQIPTPVGYSKPMYLIANLAVGSDQSWPGSPAEGARAQFEIDYVRAFSKTPGALAVVFPAVDAPDGIDTTPYGARDARGVLAPPMGKMTLRVSGDIPAGPARFTVALDGVQIGLEQMVTAVHASGQWQDITLLGPVYQAKTLSVTFTNDFYAGGAHPMDENLYVASIAYSDPVHAYSGILLGS